MSRNRWTATYGIFDKEICLYVGATRNCYNRELQHKSRFGKHVEFRVLRWSRLSHTARMTEKRFIKHYQSLGQAEHNYKKQLPRKKRRIVVSVDSNLHFKLKLISAKSGVFLERLADEAVRNYIRNYPLSEVQNA